MTSGEAIMVHPLGERLGGLQATAVRGLQALGQAADPGSAACSPCDLTQATSCL